MGNEHNFNRRTFFGTSLAGAAFAGAAAGADTDPLPRPAETRKGDMLYRSFGKTGQTVSPELCTSLTSDQPRFA
jgi:hypothetical protein